MLSWLWWRFATPRIHERLLHILEEDLVADVKHHKVVYVKPALLALLGLMVGVLGFFVVMRAGWFCFVLGGALVLWAGWKALNQHMDRLVVTNLRVFRVRGVLGNSNATIPLSRVLDITVRQPLIGRLLGYGHFTFESAAQEQGLREVRYLPHPDELNLKIQVAVQRAGRLTRLGVDPAADNLPGQ